MCGYICFGFIGFMFSGQTLIDFTSLFSPYDFEKRYYHSEIFLKWMRIIPSKQMIEQIEPIQQNFD